MSSVALGLISQANVKIPSEVSCLGQDCSLWPRTTLVDLYHPRQWARSPACSHIDHRLPCLWVRLTSSPIRPIPLVGVAMVPDWRFCCWSGLEPNWNCCDGFHPMKKRNRCELTVFWHVPHFRKLRNLAPYKYLSSDRITIQYIHKRCSFRCSFSSNSPIWDPITICWVVAK